MISHVFFVFRSSVTTSEANYQETKKPSVHPKLSAWRIFCGLVIGGAFQENVWPPFAEEASPWLSTAQTLALSALHLNWKVLHCLGDVLAQVCYVWSWRSYPGICNKSPHFHFGSCLFHCLQSRMPIRPRSDFTLSTSGSLAIAQVLCDEVASWWVDKTQKNKNKKIFLLCSLSGQAVLKH